MTSQSSPPLNDAPDETRLDTSRVVLYDADGLRQELTATLDELETTVQSERAIALLGRDTLRRIRARQNEVRARLAGDFRLVIMGDFKRGKSTLVNALLGEEVATTNVTPETVTINEIAYREEESIEAVLEDGGRVRLSREEMKADKMLPLLDSLGKKVSRVVIGRPIERLRALTLVDTPGVGDVMAQFDRAVREYLSSADAVVFVVSAMSPMSQSEEEFLRGAVAPQEFPKLLFVVNMLDFARTEEEAARVMERIRQNVGRLFPGAPVFGVSALDEFCRIKGFNRPNAANAAMLEDGFADFRHHIEDSVLANRDLIQINRAADNFDTILGDIESTMNRLQGALSADQSRVSGLIADLENNDSNLSRSIEAHKAKMRGEIARLGEEGASWMDDYLSRLESEVLPQLGDYPWDKVQKHFHFFLADSLRGAIASCLNTHQAAILKSADAASKEVQADLQLAASSQLESKEVGVATMGTPLWSHLDTFDFALNTLGLGVAGNLLSGVTRLIAGGVGAGKTEVTRQVDAFKARIESAMPELRQNVRAEVLGAYRETAQALEKQIDAAYTQDRENSLGALKQARDIGAQGEEKTEFARQTFTEVAAVIAEERQWLGKFKQKLWPSDTSPSFDAPTQAAPKVPVPTPRIVKMPAPARAS